METLMLVQNFGMCDLTLPLQPLGPLPLSDSAGMGVAIGMQLNLSQPMGKLWRTRSMLQCEECKEQLPSTGRPRCLE